MLLFKKGTDNKRWEGTVARRATIIIVSPENWFPLSSKKISDEPHFYKVNNPEKWSFFSIKQHTGKNQRMKRKS